MKNNWENPQVAQYWSGAVGEHGDDFQRLIIKPYLTAALTTTPRLDGGETTERFAQIASAVGANVQSADYFSAVEAKCDQLLSSTKVGRVLDLGAGEGFIGRWLSPYCDAIVALDVSEPLLIDGREKSQKQGNLSFFHGDLDEPNIEDDFDAWLQSRTNDADIRASSFDRVICINVLDHLQDPRWALAGLAKAMAKGGRQSELILSTLNPDFFLADQTPFPVLPANALPPALTVSMGPANTHVEIVPRNWLTMERIVSEAGFDVISCDPVHISQYPRFVQQQLIKAARLSANPSAGPFVLWRLRPAQLGEIVPFSEFAKKLVPSAALRALETALADNNNFDEAQIQLVTYEPGQIIAFRSNLPQGVFVIEKGSVDLIDRAIPRQQIGVGQILGELEIGDDPFVSRYL